MKLFKSKLMPSRFAGWYLLVDLNTLPITTRRSGALVRQICQLMGFLSLLLCSAMASAEINIQNWRTASGTQVFFVETHQLPILDVQLDFTAGSAFDGQYPSGTAGLTHALLDLGVQGMDETQLAQRLADIGAVLSGSVEMDRATLSLRSLSALDQREKALNLLHLVLTTPQFPPAVFEREKARLIAGLKEAQTRPDSMASQAFWAAMYPDHAYGRRATPESIEQINIGHLKDFYRVNYGAQRATITLVGDISRPEAEAIAEKLLNNLTASSAKNSAHKPTAAQSLAAVPAVENLALGTEHLIAHHAAQAHVLMGLPAVKRGDPDYFALLVGNYTLGGGGFVSRLMKEVREKRGFAYSVSSYFSPLTELGPFQIGLQTKKSQANEAVQVARDVLSDFLQTGPTPDELLAAKQNLAGSFPLRLDSNLKILANVAAIGFYGLPLDYLDRYTENIEKVSVEDIKSAFSRHVKLKNLMTVVVGGE